MYHIKVKTDNEIHFVALTNPPMIALPGSPTFQTVRDSLLELNGQVTPVDVVSFIKGKIHNQTIRENLPAANPFAIVKYFSEQPDAVEQTPEALSFFVYQFLYPGDEAYVVDKFGNTMEVCRFRP